MLDVKEAPSKTFTLQQHVMRRGSTGIVYADGAHAEFSIICHETAPKHLGTNFDTRMCDWSTNPAEAENLAWSILADCFGSEADSLAHDYYERFAQYLMSIGRPGLRITAHQIYVWVNEFVELDVPDVLYAASGQAYAVRVAANGEKITFVVAGKIEQKEKVSA